ncbi:glycosyltransferase family 2 protein [Hymenobacter sp. 102]|uniref:glycosyltransferase family 2 protein n=1 Tax=Hymenobacter sp. 102 TaxID=3403152 RepID=UPI003CEA93FA
MNEKEKPLVSIIVPCFNYGWIIAETLDSIISQSYENWECIVVDDGSEDDTSSVVSIYVKRDIRFKYVYQTNAGLSSARNTGIAASSGRYIQLLDADDLLHHNKIMTQVSYLENNPSMGLVFGDVRFFLHEKPDQYSRSIDMLDREWMKSVPDSGEPLVSSLLEHNIMVVNAPLVRSEVFKKNGRFNEELRSMEDWEYWLRCAIAGIHMVYDPCKESWAFVRVHRASMSQNNIRMLTYQLMVRKSVVDELKHKKYFHASEMNEKFINECYSHLATIEMKQGSISKGVLLFSKLAYRSSNYIDNMKNIMYWMIKRLKSVQS